MWNVSMNKIHNSLREVFPSASLSWSPMSVQCLKGLWINIKLRKIQSYSCSTKLPAECYGNICLLCINTVSLCNVHCIVHIKYILFNPLVWGCATFPCNAVTVVVLFTSGQPNISFITHGHHLWFVYLNTSFARYMQGSIFLGEHDFDFSHLYNILILDKEGNPIVMIIKLTM